jgi:hypothetical protein
MIRVKPVEIKEHRGRSRPESGFTRTDLAAGIAAVMVVAVLVLPGLARSNNGSSRAVCFNNLRQLGMAMTMYAGDNRDYLAYCNLDSGYPYGSGWLYGPGTIPQNRNPPRPNPQAYASAWLSGLWFKSVNDPSAYLCPLDIRDPYFGQRVNQLSSYFMNEAQSGFSTIGTFPPCKMTQIWNPACYLLWEPCMSVNFPASTFGGATYPGYLTALPPSGAANLAFRHSPNGSEILCLNGSVPFVTTNTFVAPAGSGPGPGGKTLAWWSPFSGNGGANFSTTGH